MAFGRVVLLRSEAEISFTVGDLSVGDVPSYHLVGSHNRQARLSWCIHLIFLSCYCIFKKLCQLNFTMFRDFLIVKKNQVFLLHWCTFYKRYQITTDSSILSN